MKVTEFHLQMAPSFNNGQPGKPEYWITYLHGDKEKPYVSDSLQKALKFISECAGELTTKLEQKGGEP